MGVRGVDCGAEVPAFEIAVERACGVIAQDVAALPGLGIGGWIAERFGFQVAINEWQNREVRRTGGVVGIKVDELGAGGLRAKLLEQLNNAIDRLGPVGDDDGSVGVIQRDSVGDKVDSRDFSDSSFHAELSSNRIVEAVKPAEL